MDEETKNEIYSCIEKCMQTESFSTIEIDYTGFDNKEKCSMAVIIFAKVTRNYRDNKQKDVYLAIKIGNRGNLREKLPVVSHCYRREIFFYDKIISTFHKFQLERNILNAFDAVPKCYGTILSDTLEVVMMKNLKQEGFVLHDKEIPMNLQHIHLILKNYAKLHSLSLAFRDQKKDEFEELVSNYDSLSGKILLQTDFVKRYERVLTELKKAGRDDLVAQCEQLTKDGVYAYFQQILDDIPQEIVIIHGDCHNNNFLFKYQNDDQENPSNVAFLDWQFSAVHSPVMDLSYFLYCSASKESLAQLDTLVKFYHLHLTDFLKELGSDAEKLFPYSTLVEHWKKYSAYYMITTIGHMDILFVNREDVPSTEGDKEKDGMEKSIHEKDLYRDRIIPIVEHHFNFRLT